ncbi:MAG TPA: SDR family NAD(P)-dependent oxidoreductase, partial [bacterium]|nr:SDR family NAD(P)-dependent oxidoreductase [bacterium]
MTETPTGQAQFDLRGRVAIVTGGSRGLGLEIARSLGEAGAKVVIAARRLQWLQTGEQSLRSAGIEVLARPCNVVDPAEVDAL